MPALRTALGPRGYSIRKEDLSLEQLEELRDAMTVAPFVPGDYVLQKPLPFKVYQESTGKIYLPKSYGLKRFGIPGSVKIPTGEDANLEFVGSLRPEQVEPVERFLEACRDPLRRGGVISVPCGFGKCLAPGTRVLMSDGTVKPVEKIVVGECLMGDDSTPRRVLSTCSGVEKMYRIKPAHGESFVCNESHVLSLCYDCKTIDIPLSRYLKLPPMLKAYMLGYRVPVQFKIRRTPVDAYAYGSWVCSNVYSNQPMPGTSGDIEKDLDVFVRNSVDVRMNFLAGVVDAIGTPTREGVLISHECEPFLDAIAFAARSVALGAHFVKKKKLFVWGSAVEAIPCVFKRLSCSKEALRFRFEVEPLGEGEYRGFEIDGNRRFVLGDFTVTHNTSMAIYVACKLAKKTLVVVHKEFLLQQWKERIQQFAPGARVGIIKAQKIDVDCKDFVIGSLQSLSMKEYDESLFGRFGFVVVDEVHHTSAEVFSQALKKLNATYSLGLSATPKRRDGLTKVFLWHLGDIVYNISKRTDSVRVEIVEYFDPDPAYSREQFMSRGKLNSARMINQICDHAPRVEFVVDLIASALSCEPNRRFLVLTDRRGHVDALVDAVRARGVESAAYYGGLKESQLKIAEKKQVIVLTYAYASEGLDIPGMDSLVFASPKTSIEQSAGRILRAKPEDRAHTPLIIDVVDAFSVFPNQAKKRVAYYKKCKYEIVDAGGALRDKNKVDLPRGVCLIGEEASL